MPTNICDQVVKGLFVAIVHSYHLLLRLLLLYFFCPGFLLVLLFICDLACSFFIIFPIYSFVLFTLFHIPYFVLSIFSVNLPSSPTAALPFHPHLFFFFLLLFVHHHHLLHHFLLLLFIPQSHLFLLNYLLRCVLPFPFL